MMDINCGKWLGIFDYWVDSQAHLRKHLQHAEPTKHLVISNIGKETPALYINHVDVVEYACYFTSLSSAFVHSIILR